METQLVFSSDIFLPDDMRNCNRCKKSFPIENFKSKKSDGKLCVLCELCRDKKTANQNKNTCIHNKRRHLCELCKDIPISECGVNSNNQFSENPSLDLSHKCNACNKNLPFSDFQSEKDNNKTYMTCKRCRDMKTKNQNKNKCLHGKRKERCVECGGNSLCLHKKIKGRCVECGGSESCIHDIVKGNCKLCDGSSFCQHGKRKNTCIPCGGSQICEHG